MKKFVTLFEKAENIHLIKDVGQIPYLMHFYFGYDAALVTYKNGDEYPYLKDEVKGLKLEFIPKLKAGRYSLSMLWYIFKNAKKIDILHLFHHREKTYLNFLLYKWRNPQGVAFLKSDTGLNAIKEHDGYIPQKRPKYALRAWLFERVLPKLDMISVESLEGYELIQKRYPLYTKRFVYMPNGVNLERIYELSPLKSFEEKENIILTVGRIGAREKNHELLLKALESIDLKGWKVLFIGPIEKPFLEKIDAFYTANPQLKSAVEFIGPLYERQRLYQWYARSKVFCLSSYEEGFPLVFAEALAYANAIVSTDVSGASDITKGGTLGKVVAQNDHKAFAKALQELIEGEMMNKDRYEASLAYLHERFDWKKSLAALDALQKAR